jgi:hypothetical protein
MVLSCKKDEITRSSYKTKTGKITRETCIKDLGNPGKGIKIFPKLKVGTLSSFGYSSKLNEKDRRSSLLQASKKTDLVTLIRKLNAVSILTKNTLPKTSKIFRKDLEFLQKLAKSKKS